MSKVKNDLGENNKRGFSIQCNPRNPQRYFNVDTSTSYSRIHFVYVTQVVCTLSLDPGTILFQVDLSTDGLHERKKERKKNK